MKSTNLYQDLSRFRMLPGFRGRSGAFVQVWWLVQWFLLRPSPQVLYDFRRNLLRMFGARVGKHVLVRPSVWITYPWKVSIGDYSWIGDEVVLYSLGQVEIGAHTVISQRSYVCAALHDYSQVTFDIVAAPIHIADQVWLATDVFVGPGVSIGTGTVVGARSSVYQDLPAGVICHGNPARVIRPRDQKPASSGEPLGV